MVEEQTQIVINALVPKIKEAVDAALNGTLATKLPGLKDAIKSEIWDLTVAEIGKVIGLPVNVVKTLQQVDDVVRNNSKYVKEEVEGMMLTLQGFADRLKGVDLNETITMSYKDLQQEKVKSAVSWSILSFVSGLLSGVVLAFFLF